MLGGGPQRGATQRQKLFRDMSGDLPGACGSDSSSVVLDGHIISNPMSYLTPVTRRTRSRFKDGRETGSSRFGMLDMCPVPLAV